MTSQVDDILAHYGVKGMKWGQRKARGGREKLRGTALKSLSDEDLRKKVSRLEMEKRYKDLTSRKPKAGTAFVAKTLQNTGGQIVQGTATGITNNLLTAAGTNFVLSAIEKRYGKEKAAKFKR